MTGHCQTVIVLLNAMISGTVLVLPVLSLDAGYITIPLIVLVMSLVNFASAAIIVTHA